jgi:signal transduction histidine kinase
MIEHRRVAKSLAQQVRWQLLWLGSVLFVACLLLLFVFAWRATELTTTSLMQLEAQSLVRQVAEQPEFVLPAGETFSAYRSWDRIPVELSHYFTQPPVISGEILQAEIVTENGEVEYLYLLHHIDDNYGGLFLFSRHTAAEIEATFSDLFMVAIRQAFWLTSVIFVALFFLVRWLIGRTTRPLSLLSEWASCLGKNPDQPLDIRFPVEELNRLASQLQEGVSKIQAFNQREQQFLKHTSHELRTPLAIIQASLDTLDLQNEPANRTIVQRALKASANMRQLSTALLWLARESDRPIEKSQVDVHTLCDQIIDDHRYLLLERDVRIRFTAHIECLEIESDLFSIVITNLIRNALQHSANGTVDIEISASDIRVVNPTKEEFHDTTDSGFGLGLQLVQRICSKLAWKFNYRSEQGSVDVIVVFAPTINSVNE